MFKVIVGSAISTLTIGFGWKLYESYSFKKDIQNAIASDMQYAKRMNEFLKGIENANTTTPTR